MSTVLVVNSPLAAMPECFIPSGSISAGVGPIALREPGACSAVGSLPAGVVSTTADVSTDDGSAVSVAAPSPPDPQAPSNTTAATTSPDHLRNAMSPRYRGRPAALERPECHWSSLCSILSESHCGRARGTCYQ